MVRDIEFGPGIGLPFETGARFFATLAFPGVLEEKERKNAELAWSAFYLQTNRETAEKLRSTDGDKITRLLSAPGKFILHSLKKSKRRVKDRFEAARAVRPMMSEHLGQGPHRPIPGITKWNQRQISIHLKKNDEAAANRFQERVLRPSRDVLHVAVALDYTLGAVGAPDTGLSIDLARLDIFKCVIETSAEYQPIVAGEPSLHITPEDQLSFVWKE